MKYNEDIHPMKKEIGLVLEIELLLQELSIGSGYKYIAVDSGGQVCICNRRPVPDYEYNIWVGHGTFFESEFLKPYLSSLDEKYINENWGDLLFSLGAKDE